MSKKKKLVIILTSVVVGSGVIVFTVSHLLGNAATQMRTALEGGIPAQEVLSRDLSSVIYTNGIIESQHKVSVTTELTGQVKELYVQLGDYVEAGTPLLVMDDTEIRQKIAELEKQLSDQDILNAKQKEINQRTLAYAKEEQTQLLAESQTQLDTARNEAASASKALEQARTNYNSLLSPGVEAENERLTEAAAALEQAQSTYNAAQTAVTQAENAYNTTVRSTNQQIQSAQDTIDTQNVGSDSDSSLSSTLSDLYSQLEKVTITAPQSGIITSLNISTGSMVSNGDLMVIEDNKNLKLTVSIDETDILKLSSGMHAIIKSNALEDTQINGTINKVINFATSSANVNEAEGSSGSYSAEIIIEGETQLLLGMNAKAQIVLSEKKNALSVAYDSIVTDDEEKSYIFVARESESTGDDASYTVEKIPVTLGDKGDYYTEIISDEIQEGDLIISYPEMVQEGETVQLDIEITEE